MKDLENKNIIVTGASGGIGNSIVEKLNETGANILASGTRIEKLKELKKKFNKIKILKFDISQSDKIEEFIENASKELGGLDCIVNNAGITQDNLLVRMKDHEWENVIDINLTSNFKLSKSCLRNMMKKRFGRIINISSIVGVTGNPGQSNYSASKAGIVAMAKSLAQEVASRGITVNNIAPGFISTPMTDALTEKQRESILASIPAGRFGVVEDIASCVLFLASDEASYITGQTLHINGGMAMI